jgi:tetratricopeptide (TPR) repeat protein
MSALALALALTSGATAQTPNPGVTLQDRYEAGARAYWAGETDKAYRAWRDLAEYDLQSPGLFYALGNASFRLGRMGEAKSWYERSRRLSPHDGDVLANLAAVEDTLAGGNVVRVVRRGAAAGEGSFQWWYRLFTQLTANQLALLFLMFHGLFFSALLARRWMERGTARTLLTLGNLPVLVAAVALGALLAGAAHVERQVEVAVAVSSPTEVRDGPTPEATVVFELPEGQLVRLSDASGGWRRAKVNDDLQGWVKRTDLMGVQ